MSNAFARLKVMEQDHFEQLMQTAAEYERIYRGCSQATVGPFVEMIGLEPIVFKTASGLAGGIGLTSESECGAFTGGVLVISTIFGRGFEEKNDLEKFRHCNAIIRKYQERFIKIFGSTLCPHVQTKVFGRSYQILDPDDFAAFEEAGAHIDKCPGVVAQAARLIAEILLEEIDL